MKKLLNSIILILITTIYVALAEDSKIGVWSVNTSDDPISGQEARVTTSATSHTAYGNKWNPKNDFLSFRCSAGGPEVFYATSNMNFSPIGSLKSVIWRFDKKSPVKDAWSVSTVGSGLFITDSTRKSFFKQALSAKKLGMRVTNPKGTGYSFDLIFDVRNLFKTAKYLDCFK
jgi:hypothetical protein